MKRIAAIAAIAVFVAATLATTGSAMAQDHRAKGTVPFNFNAGGTWLPAGTYTVGSDINNADTIRIGNIDKGVGTFAVGMSDSSGPAKPGHLVFRKYGDQYYLAEVRYGNSSNRVEFPVSKAEQKARARALEASLPVNDNVLVAMNDAR
jgi:hypothetical protein